MWNKAYIYQKLHQLKLQKSIILISEELTELIDGRSNINNERRKFVSKNIY